MSAAPLLPCAGAHACRIVTAPGSAATLADETAIVVWNPDSRTEVLTERMTFRAASHGPFGCLIPLPAAPIIADSPASIAPILNRAYRPKTHISDLTGVRFYSALVLPRTPARASHPPASLPSEAKTAAYESGILDPGNAAALPEWFQQNGFAATTPVANWARRYADQGWPILALRVAPDDGLTQTVEITVAFNTYRPYLPNGEVRGGSSRAAANGHRRIYVVADARMDAVPAAGTEMRDQPVRWAGPLSNKLAERAAENIGGQFDAPPAPLPAHPWITVFDDLPATAGDDIFLFPSVRQRETWPTIRRVRDRRVPLPIDLLVLGIGGTALAAGTVAAVRRRRRARPARPAAPAAPRSTADNLIAPWNGQPPEPYQPAEPALAKAPEEDPADTNSSPWIDIPGVTMAAPTAFTVATARHGQPMPARLPGSEAADHSIPPQGVVIVAPSPARTSSPFKRRRKPTGPLSDQESETDEA